MPNFLIFAKLSTFVLNITETGEALGPHQDGELCVAGPQVMQGYYKNENATEKTIMDGWLHTGDIAKYDDDGQFVIVDCLKELIKVKGLQVIQIYRQFFNLK